MNEKKKRFEVWQFDGEISMILAEDRKSHVEKGVLNCNAKLIHIITASTFEEAMSIRNLRLGFEPYKPNGGISTLSKSLRFLNFL